MEVGKYYRVIDGKDVMIGKVIAVNQGSGDGHLRGIADFIANCDDSLNLNSKWCYQDDKYRSYIEASLEEIYWLNECLYHKKYISFEKATEYNSEKELKKHTLNIGKHYTFSNSGGKIGTSKLNFLGKLMKLKNPIKTSCDDIDGEFEHEGHNLRIRLSSNDNLRFQYESYYEISEPRILDISTHQFPICKRIYAQTVMNSDVESPNIDKVECILLKRRYKKAIRKKLVMDI